MCAQYLWEVIRRCLGGCFLGCGSSNLSGVDIGALSRCWRDVSIALQMWVGLMGTGACSRRVNIGCRASCRIAVAWSLVVHRKKCQVGTTVYSVEVYQFRLRFRDRPSLRLRKIRNT